MNTFNLEKLEEQKALIESMHTVEPTMEFWEAEMARCKDTSYYFEHYWTVNGKSPNKEDVKRMKEYKNILKYYGDNMIILKSRFVPPVMNYEGEVYAQIVPKERRSRK